MPTPSESSGSGRAIVEQLRKRGFADEATLRALRRVPRERFVGPDQVGDATADSALPIDCGQTISQPYMVAAMTSELALSGTERVLEIGTGSGYQTAVLALMARVVYTVERHRALSLRARATLDGLGIENVRYRIGDGTLGWPEAAPFDRILVTAGAPGLPRPLAEQLAEGGLLVAPIGDHDQQMLTVATKEHGRVTSREVFACRFVKLLGEAGWPVDPAE